MHAENKANFASYKQLQMEAQDLFNQRYDEQKHKLPEIAAREKKIAEDQQQIDADKQDLHECEESNMEQLEQIMKTRKHQKEMNEIYEAKMGELKKERVKFVNEVAEYKRANLQLQSRILQLEQQKKVTEPPKKKAKVNKRQY